MATTILRKSGRLLGGGQVHIEADVSVDCSIGFVMVHFEWEGKITAPIKAGALALFTEYQKAGRVLAKSGTVPTEADLKTFVDLRTRNTYLAGLVP